MSRTQQLYLQHLAKTNASARVSGSSKSVGKAVGKASSSSGPGKAPVSSSKVPDSSVPSYPSKSPGPVKAPVYSSKTPTSQPAKVPETSPEIQSGVPDWTYYNTSVSMTPESPSPVGLSPSPAALSPEIKPRAPAQPFPSGAKGWIPIRPRRNNFFEQETPKTKSPAGPVPVPQAKIVSKAKTPVTKSKLPSYVPIRGQSKQTQTQQSEVTSPVVQQETSTPEPTLQIPPRTVRDQTLEEDEDEELNIADEIDQEVNYATPPLSQGNLVINLDNDATREDIAGLVSEAASRYRDEIQKRIDALTAELQRLSQELDNPRPPIILPNTEPNSTLAAQLDEVSRQSKEAQDRARKAEEEARKAREKAEEADKKASAAPPVLDFSKIDNTDSINEFLQAMQSSTINALELNQTQTEENNVRLAKLEQEVVELKTESKAEVPPDSRISTTAVALFSKGQKLLRSFGDWGAPKEGSK